MAESVALAKLKATEAAAADALEEIRTELGALSLEIRAIEDQQVADRDAGAPPDRDQEDRRAHLEHEVLVATRVERLRVDRLATATAARAREEDRMSLARLRDRARAELAELRAAADAMPELVEAEIAELAAAADRIRRARLDLESRQRAAVVAVEQVAAVARRVGEPGDVAPVPDVVDEMVRSHFSVDDIPRARIWAAAGRGVLDIAREIAEATPLPKTATGRASTFAEIESGAVAERVAKQAAHRAAQGRRTPLQDREAGEIEAERAARDLRVARWGTEQMAGGS